jgi:hypothetical protein
MTESTKLKLMVPGQDKAFEFFGAEVPDKINFGGTQMLSTQKMVGGWRIVDAMGGDDAAISWSGIFFGDKALARAQFLDQVRRSGAVCQLTWETFQYAVIVSEFKADFNKRFWIQYSMSCTVVQDELASVQVALVASPGDALQSDSARASQLSNQIGSPAITPATQSACNALTSVTSAAQPIANGLVSLGGTQSGPQIGQISTLSVSAASAIQAANNPLATLQNCVKNAIGANEQTVAGLPTLGYINPTLPMAGQVNALVAQCNAAAQLPMLYELKAVAVRMQSNLALVADPAGNNQFVAGGGNLYQLAAQTYGDATRWSDIAQASGINDPMMVGFNTVTVPQ